MDVLNEVTSSSNFVLLVAGMVLIGLIVIGLIFAKLYKRATKEMAFVRTGFGGEKIIKDGGAIVLPVLHETIAVNMNTLRIEVEKTQKDALITKDRMRVDVKADFYLRVAPNADGISMAAQTLGTRTTRVEELKKLMESKFVDVLRAVAAEMTMTEMHEQRADFVQRVQNNVANDLEKNGLELESVSLTGFDQTDLQFFNENNAFDAEGRARLAKIIEEKRKETNDIQQENRIKIEQRNLEAEKESLEIEKSEEEARLIQQQSLEFKRAEQKAEIDDAARDIAIVMAPNMSVGVNVTLKLLEMAAKALATGYDIEIIEAHHRFKKDAPSGTALAIGNSIAKAIRIIEEGLSTALDRVDGGPLAENLGALYDYCVRKLISANAHNDDAMLQEVMRLIEPIATGWNEIKKNAMSPQVAVPAMSGKPVLMEA